MASVGRISTLSMMGAPREPLIMRALLCAALVDLDGFKSYNDSFGHPAGDSLLAEIAERLAAAVAPEGRGYRLGGDEFCIVAPRSRQGREPIAAASSALSAHGEGFTIGSSF